VVAVLLAAIPSPVPVPVPETKLKVKFAVWSVFVESTIVHVVPSCGFEMSVELEPFASAWKNTGGPFIVALVLPG